jgi:glycosyltransferase involved in cell wall biosynthesis
VVSVQTTDEVGGGEYGHVDLLRALMRAGMDVQMLTNKTDLVAGTDVPVMRIDLGPKLSRRTVVRVVATAPLALFRLWAALRSQRPFDVLLVHYKKEQILSALLPGRLTRAVVWVEWGPLPRELGRGPGALVYRLAARRARKLIAVSERTGRTLRDAGVPAEKVVVVPTAVDTDAIRFDPVARERYRADWGAGDNTFVIGCVSRLHPKKRNATIILAVDKLDGDVLLVLAGEGPDERRLQGLAARTRHRVFFLPTPRGYVHEVLSACDVQVFAPSVTEAGVSRAVLFGQLVERPVIATGPEGAQELVRPGTGAIIEPHDDPLALAQTLEAYRADPERRLREGAAAAREARDRFDMPAVGARVVAILEEARAQSSR